MDDTTYSRVVAWAKVMLPLLALALLSTLFLVARTVDPAQNLPFADVDVDEIAREQRIGAPRYNTVTEEGAAIALSAKTASPDPDNAERLTGDIVQAQIDLPSGEVIHVNANAMELDYGAGTAALRDDVQITSDSGYKITTADLEIALDRTRIWSTHRTVLQGDVGEISANGFEMVEQSSATNTYVLVFKGDVKLLYTP